MQHCYKDNWGELVMLIGQKEVQAREAERFLEIVNLECFPLLQPDSLAIDGGAHVGSWTVLMAAYFDKVLAFEPCTESFIMLVKNIMALHSDKDGCGINGYKQALMDKCCKVHVHLPKGNRKTLTARQVDYGEDFEDIEGISIDSLNLDRCDFIKLDLEGAEYLALQGAKKTIRAYHPFLVVEFNNLGNRFNRSENQLLDLIQSHGYTEVWRDDVDRGFI